jgi:hypothetical protein
MIGDRAMIGEADGVGSKAQMGTVIGLLVALPTGGFCFVNDMDDMRPLTEDEDAIPISECEEMGLSSWATLHEPHNNRVVAVLRVAPGGKIDTG